MTVAASTVEMVGACFTCPGCNKAIVMSVPAEGLRRWHAGALVQVAFPDLAPEKRELLVSGLCPGCYAEIYAVE